MRIRVVIGCVDNNVEQKSLIDIGIVVALSLALSEGK